MALGAKVISGGRGRSREEADLDITPFMNLMIVLVPVLLLSMVFARITVIDIQLPTSAATTSEGLAKQQVEVVVEDDRLSINFPEGVLLREVAKTDSGAINYAELSVVLQELKRHLQNKNADRRNINLLVAQGVPYHKVISTMDAVRSYSAVVVDEVVDAELFPDISFGDLKTASASEHRKVQKPLAMNALNAQLTGLSLTPFAIGIES